MRSNVGPGQRSVNKVRPALATILREPISGPAAWRGRDLRDRTTWVHRLDAAQVAELETALAAVRGVDLYDITRGDFPLPTLGAVVERWVAELEGGRGFLLVKGLPIERYTEEEASIIYWGIGQHLGVPVSQNAAGDLLGHVRDTGRSIADPSVRGYQTRIRLPYHTDSSDIVGLLCFRPARSGGLSSIVSSTTIYNEVLRQRPDLVELMYEPFFYDRREEQGPGEDPWYTSPIACNVDGTLSIRYIRGFIETAQRFPDIPRLTGRQRELLDLIDELANDEALHLQMDFEPGDIQLVNNYVILHARTEYDDFEEPERKRHLLRLWLTLRHGRALDPAFGRGMGTVDEHGGRGGIAPVRAER